MNAPIAMTGYVVRAGTGCHLAGAGQRQAVPDPPHLLRRPQLRRARHRDGSRPVEGAAVLLPEEPGQCRDRWQVPYPSADSDVHHEIEMVVALGKGGTDIPVEAALDHVFGYGVGLDMTRRDLQGEAKKLGRPWEVGKAFEASAPCGPLVPASEIGHPTVGRSHAEGQWRACASRAISTS